MAKDPSDCLSPLTSAKSYFSESRYSARYFPANIPWPVTVRHVFNAIFRYEVFADEEYGVGSGYSAVGESLCESAKFISQGFDPDYTVFRAAHEFPLVEVLSGVIAADELDAFALLLLSELHVSSMC